MNRAVGMYDDVYEEEEASERRTEVKPPERREPPPPPPPPAPVRPGPPTETRPFPLSSEFVGTVLLIVGLAIAAATTEDVDSLLFWALATAAVVLYVVSRGFAKARTGSRAYDPREQLLQRLADRRRNG